MYLHLGQDVVVRKEFIIGIFDLDNTTSSHITRKFLADAEKTENVVNVSSELPKSFVLCEEAGRYTVYLSQLAPSTLLKRSRQEGLTI